MTCACAVPEFTDRVENRCRLFVFLVGAWLKISCMTASAIGLISRCLPRRCLFITDMAAAAYSCVMSGWKECGSVGETHRCPSRCDVTGIAFQSGDKVACWFAFPNRAVVATAACTRNLVVIYHDRRPIGGYMAGDAIVRGRRMGARLAIYCRVVVTSDTGRSGRRMIHPHGRPIRCHMAGDAVVGCRQVCAGHAIDDDIVMAGHTGGRGLVVIHTHRRPGCRNVA